jgi:hypothetical protein
MMMPPTYPERVVFHGIDRWNRPCFRSLDRPARFFGATEKLFRDDASIDTVLAEVTAADLTYFGARFDCEPMGTAAVVEIVRAADPVDPDKTAEAITLARAALEMLEAMPGAARHHPEVVSGALESASHSFRRTSDLLKPAKAKRRS